MGVIGVIRNGRYIRVAEDGTPRKGDDYFHGVAPSDLAKLDNRQLYESSERLYESVRSGVGTAQERAHASEALAETYRERQRRRSTIR